MRIALEAAVGSRLRAPAGALVLGEEITLAGRLDIEGGATTSVQGFSSPALVNNGVITVNADGAAANTLLDVGFGTFAGTGEIVLNGPGERSRLSISTEAEHGADHTVRGRGQIIGSSSSQDFVNHGTIVADDPAGALDLFIGITNRGVLSAAAGGTLGIDAFIDQSAGGRLVADNATIAPPAGGFGYTVFHGRMETVGAGRFAIPAGKITLLEGPTVAGLVEIEAGGSLDLGSFGMTNDGSIVVNSDAGSAVARFRVNGGGIGGPIEIDGTGTITLAGTPATAAIEIGTNSALTLGPSQTPAGSGRLSGDATLAGTLAPGSSAGVIAHDGTVTLAATHTFQCEIGGSHLNEFDRLSGTGTVAVAGSLEVSLIGAYAPTLGDAFAVVDGASVTGDFDTVTMPTLAPPLAWRVVAEPTRIELSVICVADITTDGTSNGVPDGQVTLSDFSLYLARWGAGDPAADLTTDGSSNGVPDGVVTLSDFSYFLGVWGSGCGSSGGGAAMR